MSIGFSHIINPVSEEENPKLFAVQKITLQSIADSRKRTKETIPVELINVAFNEANVQTEQHFDKTVTILRSVADVNKFSVERKLPIIHDILSGGIKFAAHEYIIFTNTDIALMPDFYNVVSWYCEKGHDAVVINRRRIPEKLKDAPLEVMQAHAGYMHTGYDCFVFKKSLFEKFIPTDICIGIPPAGNDIFYNLFTFAENPLLLTEKHLTFHLGMELVKTWGSPEYLKFNYSEFSKLLKQLEPHIDIAKFPGAELPFFKRHFKWLMNPTFSYPLMMRKDFSKSGKRKKESQPEVKQKYFEWLIRKVNFRDEE
jgi:hypothetical protein